MNNGRGGNHGYIRQIGVRCDVGQTPTISFIATYNPTLFPLTFWLDWSSFVIGIDSVSSIKLMPGV